MSRKTTPNGTDRSDASERPDWYVPIAPVEGDDRTVQQSLVDIFGTDPPELPDDLRDELVADLDRFLVPRES